MTTTELTAPERHREVSHRMSSPAAGVDLWPHTTRLTPWLVAAFMAMLWLLPIDAIRLPIPSPVDATPDRFLLGALALLWGLGFLARGALPGRIPRTAINGALAAFVALAFVSVLLNLRVLSGLGQIDIAFKKLFILLSLVVFFVVLTTTIKPKELRRLGDLMIGLAAVCAIGVVWEYRTGTNVFYSWSAALLPDAISVGVQPADAVWGRELISGPTSHAIAMALMFAMALPYAIVRCQRPSRRKFLVVLATALILTGAISTIRKTGVVAPVCALLTLLIYRPRQMIRLLPVGIAMIVFISLISPGALVNVKAQLVSNLFTSNSSMDRRSDYSAVGPDVKHHLVTGRGYGTFDPAQYRFLDNEYLMRVVETGFLGAAAYLLLILCVVVVAHRAARSRDPDRSDAGLAALAGAMAYLTASALFDAMGFPQAPYMLFLVAAFAAVAATSESERAPVMESAPADGPATSRIRGRVPVVAPHGVVTSRP